MKLTCLLLTLFFLFAGSAKANIGNMELRGKGDVNYLGFIKVYDAFLYTYQPNDIEDILSTDTSKCLKLEYSVSLKAKDFITSADQILNRQHPPETLQKVKNEITDLNEAYRPIKAGDNYLLCYDAPSKTTQLHLNSQPVLEIVSAPFSEIYFGIWLGSKEPIDADLRKSLLGKR